MILVGGRFADELFAHVRNWQFPRRRSNSAAGLQKFRRTVNHDERQRLGIRRRERARNFCLRIIHDEVEVHLLIYVAEERQRGGKNKDVRGGEETQQQNDFALVRVRLDGDFVHGLAES